MTTTAKTDQNGPVPHANAAEALAAFQGEMPVVHKSNTATVPTKAGGQYTYRYADLADVMGAVAPLLSKHGLAFVTLPGTDDNGGGTLTGRLMHASGDELTATLPISGSTPQALGSSLTYMRRYLLGCMTGVATDEDEDGQIAAQTQPEPQQRPQRPQRRPEPEPAPPLSDGSRDWIYSMLQERGITSATEQLNGMSKVIKRRLQSWEDLTEPDADPIILALNKVPVSDQYRDDDAPQQQRPPAPPEQMPDEPEGHPEGDDQ